ncbi:ABC transporter permease [Clostridium paraputrificum]|uniref:ABC transporter permease n=1 Tax=Clostridium paraputrificum TaxID=29363 RepID=UPI00189A6F52|nr:ABC transporter permease [Clostridium paraputrificum]MDB2125458.1 ABC transporter permease [Clostridium paraputrificum]
MNFILRGLLTIKERIGRTIILFAIMLTVCIVMICSFGIKSATNAAAVLARQKLGATVTVSQNIENMIKQQREESAESRESSRIRMERASVPLEYIDILKEYEHITGYFASNSVSANLDGTTAVGVEETTDTTISNSPDIGGFMGSGGKGGMRDLGDVTINGVNSFSMSADYVDGQSILSNGREITEDDLGSKVVMIEETFAEENGLEVGNTLKLKNTDGDIEIEAEIVGIYKSYSEVSDQGFRNTAMLPYNSIIAPYTLVNAVKNTEETDKVDSIKFYLDDPANVDEFIEFGEGTSIDLETYTLDAGNKEYESMMQPIENVASFSKTTIIIITIFGGLILALMIILSIKDRINEIGILMSLGEKRVKIIGQFLTESLAILVIAIGISVAAGNVVSNKISDVLLEKELTAEESRIQSMQGMENRPSGGNMPGRFGGATNTQEKIDNLDVNISSSDIQEMVILSLIVVTLATLLPSITIMRYNPKKILSKHS